MLVALHYAVQILRPRLGYGSDLGGRRTPWIIGGMAVLALGGVLAALATALMAIDADRRHRCSRCWRFALIGLGVGACGTSLLVLLAKRVAEDAARRRRDHRLDDDDRAASSSPPASPASCSTRSRRRAWSR